ncbi:MAG: long-chain fatty acid--CoA ligase [Janthinobacterium lividum]
MDSPANEIIEFIKNGRDNAAEFERLALALFARQYKLSAPYRRLCAGQGVSPETAQRWQDIPAVPAQAFKVFDLSCVPLPDTVAVFHSSGTTGVQTSKHYFDQDALTLYEISLQAGFEAALPQRPPLLWAMMPKPSASPNSSLSHMLSALGAARYFWDDDAALSNALSELAEPVTLFGTAFAFVQLFDGSDRNWRLPVGSIVIETGGFKGRTREVPRDELYRLFQTRLGVPLENCHSEYGMSEMASQFYGQGLDPIKRGPHWVRIRTIDPQTGGDTLPGMPGLLRHYDLANFNSVLALQTQDLGTLTPKGFELLGRSPDAEVRGCSLTVEELWAKQ